jgi:Uma2 family endonuclease
MKATEMRRWTREEYDRMIAVGLFAPGERVELIDGEILRMTPQGSAHFAAIQLVEEALRVAFGAGFDVRVQGPLGISGSSEPEPDIAVVDGTPRDYRDAHPSTALLIVEVADTSLEFDRQAKRSLYARAGIQDYWIVNLEVGCIEVYRGPEQGSYRSTRRFFTGDQVSPLAAPEASIAVQEMLP